uniref:Uncharacterized protein n=1 Tax=Anguilla anguilla TaxID=7936 RepID=A0A0E9UFW1_ANGAN
MSDCLKRRSIYSSARSGHSLTKETHDHYIMCTNSVSIAIYRTSASNNLKM